MDEAFFTSEVRQMERTLYRIAISYVRTDAAAADAVQDALLKAWEKRHGLRETQYFRTWLTRILINVCKGYLRRSGREVSLQGLKDRGQEDAERPLDLYDALQALPVNERVALVLYYLEGFPIRDIAGALHVPQGTVKSRLSRGKQKLREILKEEEVFEDEETRLG